jgi:hypothetical protein
MAQTGSDRLIGGPDSLIASGSTAAAPAANTAVATLAAPGKGTYRITVVTVAGGAAPVNNTNLELRHGSTVVGRMASLNGVALTRTFPAVSIAAGEAVTVNINTNESASVIQTAEILATMVG